VPVLRRGVKRCCHIDVILKCDHYTFFDLLISARMNTNIQFTSTSHLPRVVSRFVLTTLVAVALVACGGSGGGEPIELTILHVNDHHSHLDAETTTLRLQNAAGTRESVTVDVARLAPIVLPAKLASPDFGKVGAVFPHWRHTIAAVKPRFDRTLNQILVVPLCTKNGSLVTPICTTVLAKRP
jgi:hypothetical protein